MKKNVQGKSTTKYLFDLLLLYWLDYLIIVENQLVYIRLINENVVTRFDQCSDLLRIFKQVYRWIWYGVYRLFWLKKWILLILHFIHEMSMHSRIKLNVFLQHEKKETNTGSVSKFIFVDSNIICFNKNLFIFESHDKN